MLIDTATTIATRFPDYDNAAFVQEKFHEDWSPDREWGWQQNRAVVGHNLKIAWNLMRMNNAKQTPSPSWNLLHEGRVVIRNRVAIVVRMCISSGLAGRQHKVIRYAGAWSPTEFQFLRAHSWPTTPPSGRR